MAIPPATLDAITLSKAQDILGSNFLNVLDTDLEAGTVVLTALSAIYSEVATTTDIELVWGNLEILKDDPFFEHAIIVFESEDFVISVQTLNNIQLQYAITPNSKIAVYIPNLKNETAKFKKEYEMNFVFDLC